MIHALTPYPAMKDSGVPWLEQVPEHWNVTRSKWLFASSKELAQPDDVQLSATQAYGVIPQDEYERRSGARVVKISMHLDKRKHVEKDDFIISMRSFQGGLERAWASGAIRSSYVVLKPGNGVNVGFFSYLLKSHDYIRALQVTGGFIRDGQDLTESNFREVDLPLVPLDEQAAIVRYLDHADRRIRRTIAAKQKLIKLLQEQKQVIIHQAVTRGLDPDVKLKPSGVEWLGDVPEGWEVLPLRRRWSVTDCKHLTVPFTEEGFQLASVRETQHFDINFKQAKRTSSEFYELLIEGGRSPKRGDLIYCRNVSVGSATYVDTDECFAMGQDVCLIRSDTENQRYLNYFLSSPFMRRQLALILVGSTFKRINVEDIKALLVVVPPIENQNQIALKLDQTFEESGEIEARITEEISLLREYRTRLIADVVTGKLDVRDAAARLPELEAGALPDEVEADVDELDAEEGGDVEVEE